MITVAMVTCLEMVQQAWQVKAVLFLKLSTVEPCTEVTCFLNLQPCIFLFFFLSAVKFKPNCSYVDSNDTVNINVFLSYFLRHKYEFLHNSWSPDLRITVNPVRIGVAMDYWKGTLSFFNVDLKQHLHTFHCHFQNYVHPCFGLDSPGALSVHNAIEAPEYAFI